MSFVATSQHVWLEHGHILHAQCKDTRGVWVDATIDLDHHIGNSDGKQPSLMLPLLLLFGLSAEVIKAYLTHLQGVLAANHSLSLKYYSGIIHTVSGYGPLCLMAPLQRGESIYQPIQPIIPHLYGAPACRPLRC